jgi:hypothetical protein
MTFLLVDNPFAKTLQSGKMATAVRRVPDVYVKITPEDDDDWLVFTFEGPDPTILPFIPPLKENDDLSWREHFRRVHVLSTFPILAHTAKNSPSEVLNSGREFWSGRPGSNRRRPAWEAGILPLNYARSGKLESMELALGCQCRCLKESFGIDLF